MEEYFKPGDTAVLRYRGRTSGIAGAIPARVIEDTPGRTALWWPEGTNGKRAAWVNDYGPRKATRQPEHLDRRWERSDVLRLMYPATPYSIWAMWSAGERSFAYWYVNLEEPFARTPIGFDTMDHELDIVVAPDLSWRWKDDEEFEELVKAGIFSNEKAQRVREAGRHAISLIEANAAPFNEPWPEWEADPDWPAPQLPLRWDAEFKISLGSARSRSA